MNARYVLRRLVQAVVTLAGVVVVTFVLVQLAPGDAADTLGGEGTPESVRQLRADLRLDRPLPEQLASYGARALRGDLGVSFSQPGRSVTSVIGEYLPNSLLLMGTAVTFSTALGVALALRAARRPRGPFDSAASVAALLGFAIPGFWLGQMAILLLALRLDLFPIGLMTDPRAGYTGFDHVVDVAIHLSLPVLVLAVGEVAMVYRITRNGVLQERRKDYVRTALAKGVASDQVLSEHALRNALLPLVTVLGARMGFLFSGAVLTERLFAWPGMGTLLVSATEQRDRPVVLGIVVVVSFALVAITFVTDMIYAVIDPRIRYD